MIDYELKDLFYQQDIDKQLIIQYDTGTITNNEIHSESFTLEESICSESNLRFGSCEASSISFTVSNIFEPLKDKWLDVSMVLAKETSKPLQIGRFKVYSDVPTADRKKRNVTAYDALFDIINTDVSDWYNELLPESDSTVTLREFRDSFFEHFGIVQEEISLINDEMTVEKTIQPEKLSGKTVISAICEINACFGHIGRNGNFQYVKLEPIEKGIYPSATLYPKKDLYPVVPSGFGIYTGTYISAQYEDFETELITKFQVRQEEDDIGAVSGDGDNSYVIQDNFLVYGKDAEELQAIADKILAEINGIYYKPFEAKCIGNPCLEVGDAIRLSTARASIHSYILQRKLTGVQTLRDTYTADGEQEQSENVNSVSSSIIQLKGKTNVLTRTLEETRLEMMDLENGLSNTISATASQIRTELNNTKSGLESSLTQTASQIRTELSDTEQELSSSITQTASSLKTEIANTEKKLSSSISQTATQIRSEVADSNTDLQSKITQNANSISSEVARATSAEGTLSTKITQTDEKIRSDVKATYETIEVVEEKVSGAKTAATAYTDTRLALYSTTTEMKSAIEQESDSITLSVNKQISETKTYADTVAGTAESNAKADTAEKLKSYSTTTEMKSAIEQESDSITLGVLSICETKTNASTNYTILSDSIYQTTIDLENETQRAKYEEANLSITANEIKTAVSSLETNTSSQIAQLSSQISLKVSKDSLISEINVSDEVIRLSAGRLILESGYFTLNEYGVATLSDSTGATAYMFGGMFLLGSSYITDGELYGKNVSCQTLNNSTPITSSNLDNWVSGTQTIVNLDNAIEANATNISDISEKLSSFVTTSSLSSTLSSYAKKSDLSGYLTSSDLSGYATTSDLDNYVTSSEFSSLESTVTQNVKHTSAIMTAIGQLTTRVDELEEEASNYATTTGLNNAMSRIGSLESRVTALEAAI